MRVDSQADTRMFSAPPRCLPRCLTRLVSVARDFRSACRTAPATLFASLALRGQASLTPPDTARRATRTHPALRLAGLVLLLMSTGAYALEVSREYRIKAAYLYNLLRFIDWPAAEIAPDQPITICVYGFNPFDRYLDQLEQREVNQRPISVQYVGENRKVAGCNLVFISQYNTTEPALLRAADPIPPVLTVGDGDDFIRRGGIVGLVTVGNNIQLDINRTRGRAAGFQFSANLLEVARTVR